MTKRRDFLIKSSTILAGGLILPSCMNSGSSEEKTAVDIASAGGRKVDIQLYF